MGVEKSKNLCYNVLVIDSSSILFNKSRKKTKKH